MRILAHVLARGVLLQYTYCRGEELLVQDAIGGRAGGLSYRRTV